MGKPKKGIDITDEMIDAAVDALRLHFESYDLRGTVKALLVAMGAEDDPQGLRLRTKNDLVDYRAGIAD